MGFIRFNGSNGHKLGHNFVLVHCTCGQSWQLCNSSTWLSLFDSEWICLFCVLAGWQLCDAEQASGDYAGSHGHQHQSLSEDNADSVCHSAVPQTRTRVLDSFGELLKFKEHVFFQQWLNPQHYCPLPLVKPLFLSLPSQECANSNAKCQWLIFTQSKTMWRTRPSVSLISKSP